MNGHEKQKEQSRRMIEEALFALMGEKSYLEITVSEIARRADVSRRTFYRLYKSREEVLAVFFQKLCREYQKKHSALNCYDVRRIAGEYFDFWYQYREVLLLIHDCGLDAMLYYWMNRFALEVVQSRMGETQELSAQHFAVYSAGGFGSLLFQWIDGGMEIPPREYAGEVSDSIMNFIKTAV